MKHRCGVFLDAGLCVACDEQWPCLESKRAAAPELYESLKNLVGLAKQRGRLDEYKAAISDAEAAIAKVERS